MAAGACCSIPVTTTPPRRRSRRSLTGSDLPASTLDRSRSAAGLHSFPVARCRTRTLSRSVDCLEDRIAATDLFHKPIISDFPIVVDVLVAGAIRLLPVFPLFDLRGVLELLFGDVQLEAVGLFIVGQHRPGDRIVILADAEEAAETHDRIGDPASELVDHQALDAPDALAVRVIDWHSLHFVACDQG